MNVEKTKIRSAYMTRFGRREDDLVPIALEAVHHVMAGGDPGVLSDVYIASYAATELAGLSDPFRVLTHAIQSAYPGLRATYHGLFKTGGEALFTALTRMGQGRGTGDALVLGAEKMTHVDPASIAGRLAGQENDHDRTYRATLPALGALVTRAYLDRYRIPIEALHHVAVKAHRNAALNPQAHFQRARTIEDVATSPMVADPMRRLHCAPTSDGAAAVILSRVEGRVGCIGWGSGIDTMLFQEREDPARFIATRRAGEAALGAASRTTADIDIVEIHDAFSSFELINLEELGFFPAGAAWHALMAGDLNINADVAVNASGGMKARGHPIGATGLSGFVELNAQLTGTAGPRQHHGAQCGLVQSVGGVSKESYVFVLEAES